MVLQVVDSDSSVLPIAGRPATIKWYAFYNILFFQTGTHRYFYIEYNKIY